MVKQITLTPSLGAVVTDSLITIEHTRNGQIVYISLTPEQLQKLVAEINE